MNYWIDAHNSVDRNVEFHLKLLFWGRSVFQRGICAWSFLNLKYHSFTFTHPKPTGNISFTPTVNMTWTFLWRFKYYGIPVSPIEVLPTQLLTNILWRYRCLKRSRLNHLQLPHILAKKIVKFIKQMLSSLFCMSCVIRISYWEWVETVQCV